MIESLNSFLIALSGENPGLFLVLKSWAKVKFASKKNIMEINEKIKNLKLAEKEVEENVKKY